MKDNDMECAYATMIMFLWKQNLYIERLKETKPM